MNISITRLKLHHPGYLPVFLFWNSHIVRQVQAASGFMGGKTGLESLLTFWTLTGWADDASTKQFRNTQSHGAAMPKLLDWCCEASVARTAADRLLSWEEAYAVMRDHGRVSPIRRPSARHIAQKTVPETPHFYHRLTRPIPPSAP
jgi:hypothetical protein